MTSMTLAALGLVDKILKSGRYRSIRGTCGTLWINLR